MVFREETIIQVRSMVEKLEKEPPRSSRIDEIETSRSQIPSAQSEKSSRRPKLPNNNQPRSCLASGLFHSVYKCRLRKVKFLLDTGLNINARNDYGYNVLVAALHIELPAKRRKMFELLLEHDADPFQKDPKYKRNTLMWASALGRDEQANLLIDTYLGEFDMHEKDKDGMTALHLATQAGHTDVVKSLVKEMTRYGTSVDVPDGLGLTPYLHAKRLGFGLIADILKVEGGASESQGDLYSFKRADEWRDIGIRERNEMARQRRTSQYEQAAIAGSARMLMEFEGPGYDIISIPTPKERRQTKTWCKDTTNDNDDKDSKCVRIFSPKSQASMPPGTDYSNFRNRYISGSGTSRTQGSHGGLNMSLLQMAEPKKGVAPKHFHSSEIDDTKVEQYKHIIGGLNSMMDLLAIQHSKSFRNSVPPMKPRHDEPVVANKRSTLAAIFGKNKSVKKNVGKRSPKSSAAKSGSAGKRGGKSK